MNQLLLVVSRDILVQGADNFAYSVIVSSMKMTYCFSRGAMLLDESTIVCRGVQITHCCPSLVVARVTVGVAFIGRANLWL